MARRIGWICLALGLAVVFANKSDAQIWHPVAKAVQTPLRFLGHGNGHGYHYRNPGPDTSYYNPWTQKNSVLISQSPEFLARYGHELRRTPMEILQNGNISWGHQVRYGQPRQMSQQLAAPLRADFVPATQNPVQTNTEPTEDEDDTKGDFQSNPADEQVEDRFEQEADDLDNADATEDSVGGFESLRDAVRASSESASLLQPLNNFQPASFSGN